jgi:hypothetical protein
MNRKSKNTIAMPTGSDLTPAVVGVSVSTAATMIIQIPIPLARVSMYKGLGIGTRGGDAAHNSTHDEQKLSSISINGPLSFRSQDISLKKGLESSNNFQE